MIALSIRLHGLREATPKPTPIRHEAPQPA